MRKLVLGSQELVRGLITDLEKNDLTDIKSSIELAVTAYNVEDAPVSGWTVQDDVRQLNPYTVMPAKLYTGTTRGKFLLWGRWGDPPENVILPIGIFQVI